MMDFALLELRKNRLLFWTLAGCFGGSLALAAGYSAVAEFPLGRPVDAAALFWTFAGLPLCAVLMGADAGACLRAEPTENAESVLPLSPSRRAAGALASSGVRLALLTTLVLLGALAISPGWRDYVSREFLRVSQGTYYDERLPLHKGLSLASFTLAYLLAGSFAWSHWLRHGIAGGLLGLLFGAGAALALGVGLGLEALFDARVPFTAWAFVWMALGLGAAAWSTRQIAIRAARAPRWGLARFAAAGGALALGALGAGGSLWHFSTRLAGSGRLVERSEEYYRYGNPSYARLHSPAAREAESRGALIGTLDGALHWAAPGGARTELLPGRRRGIRDLFRWASWSGIDDTVWDAEGALWVLRDGGPQTERMEIWRGSPERGLRLAGVIDGLRYARGFVWRGPELGVQSWEGKLWSFRSGGVGRPEKVEDEDILEGWLRAGKAARLGKDSRTLAAEAPRPERWALPGIAGPMPRIHPAYAVGDRDAFLVPLKLGEGRYAMAVCRPGGKVELVWRGASPPPERLYADRGGALMGFGGDGLLYLVSAGGEFLPPLNARPVFDRLKRGGEGRTRLLRFDGARVWLAAPDRLVVFDARSGAVQGARELPWRGARRAYREDSFHAARDGVFHYDGRRLQFVGWDMTVKDLGPA